MLIVTRRVGEAVVIGEHIEVRVLEAHGRQVRLGIEAPASVVVLREELVGKYQREPGANGAGGQP